MNEKKIQLNLDIPYKINNNFKEQVLISSHERSGTHFLMNSIDCAFKYYSSKEFINFDYFRLGSFINFYSKDSLENFFLNLYNNKNVSLFKSHFNASFFETIKIEVLRNIKFIYIYRDLIETMKSFWIYINNVKWNEGPKNKIFSEFCFEKPRGQLIRYDDLIGNNLIERYFYNFKSWVEFSKKNNVLFINYADLNNNYKNTLEKISKYIDLPIIDENKFDRSNYFEVNFKNKDNLLYDEQNNQKIKDYYKKLLEKDNINSKIMLEII